jgi:hypothetical protein
MKELRHIFIALFLAIATSTWAQRISLLDGEQVYPIQSQQTQTEVKPGWKIVDLQLKSKWAKYLWGTKSKQLIDTPSPQFIIDTDSLVLSDLVLIKLKTKKEYRSIPKPLLQDNKCIHVDLSTFSISAYRKYDFLIQPITPLEPGEYIFTFTTLSPVGDFSDWIVWPFSIAPQNAD